VFAADAGESHADDADDPMRTAMRQMTGVFAQLERGMIRARMARGKRAAAAQGRYTSANPPAENSGRVGLAIRLLPSAPARRAGSPACGPTVGS